MACLNLEKYAVIKKAITLTNVMATILFMQLQRRNFLSTVQTNPVIPFLR